MRYIVRGTYWGYLFFHVLTDEATRYPPLGEEDPRPYDQLLRTPFGRSSGMQFMRTARIPAHDRDVSGTRVRDRRDHSRRRAGLRMPVVCQCRRIRASPGPYEIRENRLLMRVIGPARTRSDASGPPFSYS
jgi:hypothetical protein